MFGAVGKNFDAAVLVRRGQPVNATAGQRREARLSGTAATFAPFAFGFRGKEPSFDRKQPQRSVESAQRTFLPANPMANAHQLWTPGLTPHGLPPTHKHTRSRPSYEKPKGAA